MRRRNKRQEWQLQSFCKMQTQKAQSEAGAEQATHTSNVGGT